MKRTAWALAAGLLLLGAARAGDKGKTVDFDGLKSTAPAGWKQEEPTSAMRLTQFRLPRVEGDPADAELIIFKGLGGTVKQNVDRWKNQFLPPEGKSIDDVARVTEFKVAGNDVAMLDVRGTYLDGPPMLPASRKTRRPDYRMLAVQFKGPQTVYHVLLRGPAKTIEKNAKDFESWVKAFK
jgi:hypothetical protein